LVLLDSSDIATPSGAGLFFLKSISCRIFDFLHRERPGLHEPRKGYESRLSVRPGLTFDVLIVFRLCVCDKNSVRPGLRNEPRTYPEPRFVPCENY
jgi:hypothetical protein